METEAQEMYFPSLGTHIWLFRQQTPSPVLQPTARSEITMKIYSSAFYFQTDV